MPRHCDSCGIEIPTGAVEAGKALKFEDSFYCEECKADVLPMIDPDGKAKARQKPEGFVKAVRSATAAAAATGGAKAAAAGPTAKGEPARERSRDKGGAPAGGKGGPGERGDRGERRPERAAPAGAGKPRAEAAAAPPARGAGKRGDDDSDGKAARPKTGKGPAVRAGGDKARTGSSSQERGGRPATPAGRAGRERGRRDRDRDDDDEAEERGGRRERRRGSGAGSGEVASPPRSKLPLPVMIGGGVALVALIVVIVVLATRDRGEEPAGEQAGTTAPVLDREAMKQRSQQAFASTQATIGQEPESFARAIETWEGVIPSLEPVESAKARAEIESLKERQSARAAQKLAEVEKAAEGHISAKRYADALRALADIPTELVQDAGARRKLQDLRRRADLGRAAEREAQPLLAKAEEHAGKGDYQLAMGVLEGFDAEHYKGTAWAAEVAERIAGYEARESEGAQQLALERMAERERQRVAEEAAKLRRKVEGGDKWLASAAYEPWFGDDLFTFKFPEPAPPDAWKMKDRVLIGTSAGPMRGGSIGALTGVGSSDWKDYVFEVEYKVVKGGFKLGCRFNKNTSAFVLLEPEVRSGGGWEKITISVRGRSGDAFQELTAGGSKRKVKFDAHDSSEGGISFVLDPHSEVHFRNLGVKVLPDQFVLE